MDEFLVVRGGSNQHNECDAGRRQRAESQENADHYTATGPAAGAESV